MLEPVNRICPRCKSGSYMRSLASIPKVGFDYKCINCNSYWNEEDLTKSATIPIAKNDCTTERVCWICGEGCGIDYRLDQVGVCRECRKRIARFLYPERQDK